MFLSFFEGWNNSECDRPSLNPLYFSQKIFATSYIEWASESLCMQGVFCTTLHFLLGASSQMCYMCTALSFSLQSNEGSYLSSHMLSNVYGCNACTRTRHCFTYYADYFITWDEHSLVPRHSITECLGMRLG